MARWVDLTLTLRSGMRGVEAAPKHEISRDGWNSSQWNLYSHAGTHVDAQRHFDAGPETVDRIGLERCFGPAWVIRLGEVRPGQRLEVADLGPVADSLRPGESLLLATGWSRYADDSAMYRDQLPCIGEEMARWCVERQVKMLGVEPPSVANLTDREELSRVHRILLAGGVLVAEGLTNLESLREPRVLLIVLPLKLKGGDGSPARAMAVEGVDLTHWTSN